MTSRRNPSRKVPCRLPGRGAIGLGVTTAGLAMLLSVRPADTTGADLVFLPDPTDATGSTDLVVATTPSALRRPAPRAHR